MQDSSEQVFFASLALALPFWAPNSIGRRKQLTFVACSANWPKFIVCLFAHNLAVKNALSSGERKSERASSLAFSRPNQRGSVIRARLWCPSAERAASLCPLSELSAYYLMLRTTTTGRDFLQKIVRACV